METASIKFEHATLKHVKTTGMIEWSHEKLKQVLKIRVEGSSPHWSYRSPPQIWHTTQLYLKP